MKLINTVFIFVLCLSVGLLAWTVYKSTVIPTQHETLFLQDYTSLNQNYNQIKEDEAIFDKYYKIENVLWPHMITFKIIKLNPNLDTKIKISNIKGLLTKTYTNKFNKILKASFNKHTNEYTLTGDNLTIDATKWRIEFKMDVVLNGDKLDNKMLVLYKQINTK
jgi:hypothetical protein